MSYKGFISNKKKGTLTTLTSSDVFVVEKPTQVTKSVTGISVEVDPNDPTQKIIIISFSDGSSLADVFIDNEGNDYSHPLKAWVDKSNLAGAQVIANITVDSLGHPTNWIVRNITAADVGASSIGHTHNYENPLTFVGEGTTSVARSGNTITITSTGNTYTHPAKVWTNKADLTGGNVISNLTIDSLGHPTNWTTRTLTPGDIGAQPVGNYDNYYSWSIRANALASAEIRSGTLVSFNDGDLIKVTRLNGAITINKTPKPIYYLTGASSITGGDFSSARWYNYNTTANPTLTINIDSNTTAGHEIEGDFTGTGRLTIVAGAGLTLVYPTEFFTNTYPAGGVWGVKFISSTEAVLFGKQIPIGI